MATDPTARDGDDPSDACSAPILPLAKAWRHRRVLTEHAYDKMIEIDITSAEFEHLLDADAEVVEAAEVGRATAKEVVLYQDRKRPLHVVVVVDDQHREEPHTRRARRCPVGWSRRRRRLVMASTP